MPSMSTLFSKVFEKYLKKAASRKRLLFIALLLRLVAQKVDDCFFDDLRLRDAVGFAFFLESCD